MDGSLAISNMDEALHLNQSSTVLSLLPSTCSNPHPPPSLVCFLTTSCAALMALLLWHFMTSSAFWLIDQLMPWHVITPSLPPLPSLRPPSPGIVQRFSALPDVIGMHGGLPPPDAFPLAALTTTLADGSSFIINDPRTITAAQQYNLHAKVRQQ